jgi:hypothetical protein
MRVQSPSEPKPDLREPHGSAGRPDPATRAARVVVVPDLSGVGLFNVPGGERPPALGAVALERVRTTRPRRFELAITFDAQPFAPVGHDDRHRPLLGDAPLIHGRPGTRNPLRPGPGRPVTLGPALS